jgi:RNA polymerase sigma-B factor
MGPSLLRDWDMLQDQIIPPLLGTGSRRASVWSIGEPADAVAVTVAFAEARGGPCGEIRTFTSGTSGVESPTSHVSVGAADVGCLPKSSRAAWFERDRHRWVPKAAIAEHIVLRAPSEPVDLLTVRSARQVDAHALNHLRAGGQMLIVEPPPVDGAVGTGRVDSSEEAIGPPGMAPVDGSGRLFRKLSGTSSRLGERTGRLARDASPSETQGDAPTLAARQRQEALILTHLDLAKALARRFGHRGQPIEDLEQAAMVALAGAARRFDPERGKPFSAFASASIVGELKRYFRDKTWSVRVPRSLQELHMAVNAAREELGHELGGSPTVAQVAQRLGVGEEDVLEAMEAGSSYRADSLEVGEGDGERAREIPVVDPSFERVLDRQRLRAALPRLNQQERQILKALYLDSRTQADVAGDLGISQMQVSRVLARSVAKLQR